MCQKEEGQKNYSANDVSHRAQGHQKEKKWREAQKASLERKNAKLAQCVV